MIEEGEVVLVSRLDGFLDAVVARNANWVGMLHFREMRFWFCQALPCLEPTLEGLFI